MYMYTLLRLNVFSDYIHCDMMIPASRTWPSRRHEGVHLRSREPCVILCIELFGLKWKDDAIIHEGTAWNAKEVSFIYDR